MQIVKVDNWAEGPRLINADKPSTPAADSGEMQLRVLATSMHQVVRSRASGKHYSAKSLPHVPGVDFTGKDETTGKLYFVMCVEDGFGSFAEYVNVPKGAIVIPLPDTADPIKIAAGVNPAMSSWMAITERTNDLPKDWTVLIVGVTSASGRLAVHVAKALGAAKVIGAARNVEAMKADAGLDGYIELREDVTETDFSQVQPDVILDYVYGDVAQHLLSINTKKPVQYVQIGTLSGKPEISLAGPLLRSSDLTIRGAGPGSWRLSALAVQLKTMVPAMLEWPAVETVTVPLSEIERVWNDTSSKGRITVVP